MSKVHAAAFVPWALILLVASLTKVMAFLPDRASFPNEIPPNDYTLKDLTKETLVRVVAEFFEESNTVRYNPGDLTQMDPLTPSSLFTEHYGECVSSAKFESAMGEVVEGNLNVDRQFQDQSSWHFNAEQINEGNRRMISLRNSILASLNNDQPDYAGIRENIGRYLHLLQDFYSNTNWVHLYPTAINLDLGVREITDTVSSDQDFPCRNCNGPPISSRPELHDCKRVENYHPFARYLFSGYRQGQDIPKPQASSSSWGKCSHGGKFDSSWTEVATGGINKETSDPAISPHYHLHSEAATLAIRAGEVFFNDEENGIRTIIGEEKFQQLLSLETGSALVLVIDDTGSMGEEIEAVKNTAILLVGRFSGTCFASAQYIVSPFNDPTHGPLTDTTDPQVCINALQALYPHGGGDCPELCMAGVVDALQRVVFASDVYIWTDADAKDADRMPEVEALALQKKAKLNFLLTGDCGRRRKRDASSNPYSALSEATGGTVYHTDNDNIDSVSSIIIADTVASEVSVLRWNSDDFTDVSLKIPVDITIDQLAIKVSGPSPRTATTLLDSSGSVVSYSDDSIEIIVDTSSVFTFLLRTQTIGIWALNMSGVVRGQSFLAEVSARSFLDFTFQILEKDDRDFLLPVEGLPLAGSNATFLIDIISPELIQSIDDLLLQDANGQSVLLQLPLTDVAGRSSGVYVVDVTLPEQTFTVSVLGRDFNGTLVQRMNPAVVQVLGFTLGISSKNNTIGNLVPGGSGTFGLVLGNLGAGDTFDLIFSTTTRSATLATPIAGDVTPSNIRLEEQDTAAGVVTLSADGSATAGDSVLVTVTMISQTTSERNYVSMSVTLSEEIETEEVIPVDVTAPTCRVSETNGTCTSEMITTNCEAYNWSIRVALQDDQAIAQIEVTDYEEAGGQYSFHRSDASNTDVIYASNCCCPNVSVTVSDTVGNTDRCGVDYFTSAGHILPASQCVRDCDERAECQNEALCIGGRCDCAPGFNGTLCENNIDDCVNHGCLNSGTCEDGVQIYDCNCTDTGYEGQRCEKNINDCFDDACKNGGECVDQWKSFQCYCMGTGFEGDFCEIDINECEQGICINGGVCTNLNGSYICDCLSGWEGINCETNIDECVRDAPCQNNATCDDSPGSYACLCQLGFNGTTCEIDIDECSGDPCQHEGTCIDMINHYRCDCAGYEGMNCENDIDECESYINDCNSQATCTNTEGSFICACTDGYQGDGVSCSQCDPDRYGYQCSEMCTCVDGASCDNVDGNCTCSMVFDGQDCDKANLNVVIETSTDLILDGTDVTLTCKVNLPTGDIGNSVTWTLPDNSTRVAGQTGEDDGTYELLLTSVQPGQNSGEYTCVATTTLLGTLEVTDKLNIDVKAPGRIINAPKEAYSELGETAEFNCTVYGNTAPVITWFRVNGKIMTDDHDGISVSESNNSPLFKTSSLLINDVVREHNGSYVCDVNNTANVYSKEQRYDQGNYHLFILEPPAITIDTVEIISASEILVEWSVTFTGNLQVNNCTIGYSESSATMRMMRNTVESRIILSYLRSYTEYMVDVTCENLVGASETVVYDGSRVITLQSEPGVPTNVRLTDITHTSVNVQWDEPGVLNGPIAFYVLELQHGIEPPTEIQSSNKQMALKVHNLVPGTNYTIYIRAVNVENGNEYRGNRTEGLTFTTLTQPLEDAVQSPVLVPKETPNRITARTFKMMVYPASDRIDPVGCYEIVVIPLDKDSALPAAGDPDQDYPPSSINDYDTSGARPGSPYSAVLIEGSVLTKPMEIVIGDKRITSCSYGISPLSRKKREATNAYQEAENGPLKPDTTYSTFTRAFILKDNGSMTEYESSSYMKPITTKPSEKDNTAWFVVAVIVVILICLCILAFVFAYYRRKRHEQSDHTLSKVDEVQGVELSDVVEENEKPENDSEPSPDGTERKSL